MTKLNLSTLGHSFSDDEIGTLMENISTALGEKVKTAETNATRIAYFDALVLIAEEVAKMGNLDGEDMPDISALREALEAMRKLDQAFGDKS